MEPYCFFLPPFLTPLFVLATTLSWLGGWLAAAVVRLREGLVGALPSILGAAVNNTVVVMVIIAIIVNTISILIVTIMVTIIIIILIVIMILIVSVMLIMLYLFIHTSNNNRNDIGRLAGRRAGWLPWGGHAQFSSEDTAKSGLESERILNVEGGLS